LERSWQQSLNAFRKILEGERRICLLALVFGIKKGVRNSRGSEMAIIEERGGVKFSGSPRLLIKGI